jgi:hypothetical protein
MQEQEKDIENLKKENTALKKMGKMIRKDKK